MGGVDGDPLAIGPAVVEGVGARARCFLYPHGVESRRRLLVVVLSFDPLRGADNVGDADLINLTFKFILVKTNICISYPQGRVTRIRRCRSTSVLSALNAIDKKG